MTLLGTALVVIGIIVLALEAVESDLTGVIIGALLIIVGLILRGEVR